MVELFTCDLIVRSVIDQFIRGDSTVNICALDLSKAFDRMNRYALYTKRMQRTVPVSLLCITDNLVCDDRKLCYVEKLIFELV